MNDGSLRLWSMAWDIFTCGQFGPLNFLLFFEESGKLSWAGAVIEFGFGAFVLCQDNKDFVLLLFWARFQKFSNPFHTWTRSLKNINLLFFSQSRDSKGGRKSCTCSPRNSRKKFLQLLLFSHRFFLVPSSFYLTPIGTNKKTLSLSSQSATPSEKFAARQRRN